MSHVRRAVACIVTLTAALCIPALTAGAADPTTVSNAVAYLSASPPQHTRGPRRPRAAARGTTTPCSSSPPPRSCWPSPNRPRRVGAGTRLAGRGRGGRDPEPAGREPRCRSSTSSAAAATTPGQAAKYLVLVGAPLGQDTTTLAATIGDPAPDGSFATDLHFTDTLFAALAKRV